MTLSGEQLQGRCCRCFWLELLFRLLPGSLEPRLPVMHHLYRKSGLGSFGQPCLMISSMKEVYLVGRPVLGYTCVSSRLGYLMLCNQQIQSGLLCCGWHSWRASHKVGPQWTSASRDPCGAKAPVWHTFWQFCLGQVMLTK